MKRTDQFIRSNKQDILNYSDSTAEGGFLMKYTQIAPEDTPTPDNRIMKDWNREAGQQPGMILEVLNLSGKVLPKEEEAA